MSIISSLWQREWRSNRQCKNKGEMYQARWGAINCGGRSKRRPYRQANNF